MRPSSSPFVSPSGLVDKRLAPMWEAIEAVREYLPQVAHVSYYLESIFNLDRNLTLLADENVDHNILKDIQIFQGANAYEIAVREGYVGDVTSWLASLVGPQGDQGIQGVADQAVLDTMNAATAAAQAAADAAQTQVDATDAVVAQKADTSYVDTEISDGDTAVLNAVNTLLSNYVTVGTYQALAQSVFATEIQTRDNEIAALDAAQQATDTALSSVDTDLTNHLTAYSAFLSQNALDIARIDVLETSAGDYGTRITNIETTNISFASTQTLLQATQATQSADILDLQTVTADNATAITTLQVASGDASSAITNLQTVQAQQATSITNLNTTVGANTAAISSEVTTRASETGALASRADTLELDVGNLQGSVSTNATLIGDLNGRMVARYAIAVDGGGNGSFISLEDGVSTPSKIELDAALIELNGDVIITGSLDTPQMAADAVTERLTTNDTSTRAIASNESLTELESVVYNKTQADSDIRVSFHCRHEGSTAIAGDDYAVEIHIQRNGVSQTLGDFWYYRNQGFPHSEFGSITLSGIPAGNSTWSLDMRASNGGGISGVTATRTQFTVEEIKK